MLFFNPPAARLMQGHAMNLYFSDTQLAHKPTQFMMHGRIVAPFETPERASALVTALVGIGLTSLTPRDHGREAILAVHADHYVRFLETAYQRFSALSPRGPAKAYCPQGNAPPVRPRSMICSSVISA